MVIIINKTIEADKYDIKPPAILSLILPSFEPNFISRGLVPYDSEHKIPQMKPRV